MAPSDAPRNGSAAEAASPASFQPVNAQTSAGARRPSGRCSQISGCIRITVHHGSCLQAAVDPPSAIAACARRRRRRRLRLHAQGPADCRAPGTPYLALELRDRTGAIPAPRRSATPTCSPGASTAATSCASRAGSSASATSSRSSVARDRRAPADDADPAAFLPVAYRDLDELDGFLEHLAGEVHDPRLPARCSTALLGDGELRAALRRAPCTRAGHHAYLGGLLEHTVAVAHARARDLRAAPAPEPGPAARPRRSSTTSARRASSPTAPRSGSPTRAGCSATSSSGCGCSTSAPGRPGSTSRAGSRSRTACSATTAPTPRPAALRLGRGARAVPPQRARRRASRARSSTGSRRRRRRRGHDHRRRAAS